MGTALLVALALLLVGSDAAAGDVAPAVPEPQQGVSGREEFPAFSIELPRGWRKVALAPARSDGESMSVRFEDPRGLYFHVEVNPLGHGVSADAAWRCEVGKGGGLTVEEEPRCAIPAGAEPEEEGCAQRDGRLDVFVSCQWTVAGTDGTGGARSAVFMFGSATLEDGVDLDEFRRILASIRVKR